MSDPGRGLIRLAEPLLALSGVGDLTRTADPGASARTCFIACRLARAMSLPDHQVTTVFYTALLQHVGCVGYSREAAAVFGGREIAMNLAGSHTDFSDPVDVFRTFIPELSAGTDLLTTMRIVVAALSRAPALGPVIHRAQCEVGAGIARRIGLDSDVADALLHVEEWYDGRGGYLGTTGDAIPLAARIVLAAFTAEVFDELGGPGVASQVVAARAGKQLDPAVAAAYVRAGPSILDALARLSSEEEVLAEEPKPHRITGEQGLDAIAIAFGDAVDLKSPHTHGTARRAFELAQHAAPVVGLDETRTGRLRRAAALRDIGRAAIPSAALARPAATGASLQEDVELHAYRAERLLARTAALAAEGVLTGMHHEREDGSGYHRGLRGDAIPPDGKLLAAIDVFVMTAQPEDGHGTPKDEPALAHLQALADQGALDRIAVRAVIAAVRGGSRHIDTRPTRPAGLSARQVDVLRLIAAGLTNREIGRRLTISSRTAEHHVQDVYAKIGTSSRAAAALFAMEHHLL